MKKTLSKTRPTLITLADLDTEEKWIINEIGVRTLGEFVQTTALSRKERDHGYRSSICTVESSALEIAQLKIYYWSLRDTYPQLYEDRMDSHTLIFERNAQHLQKV